MVTATLDEASNVLRVKLEGTMMVHDLQEIQAEIICDLPKGASAEMELSEVAEIDSAGLQLLYAIKSKVQREGGAFSVAAMSVPVRDFLAIYRLNETFGHLR